jgi:hypothetical protein
MRELMEGCTNLDLTSYKPYIHEFRKLSIEMFGYRNAFQRSKT